MKIVKIKLVKRSFTIREDLFRFAAQQAAIIAQQRGQPVNLSGYFSELVMKDKKRTEAKEPAAA